MSQDFKSEIPSGMSFGWPAPEEIPTVEENLWLRLDGHEILTARVLSEQPLHYRGHWVPAGRVYRLCMAPKSCPFCPRPASQGRPIAGPAEWRHVLTVELRDGRQRIWEFGEAVAKQLQQITGFRKRALENGGDEELGGNPGAARIVPLRGLSLTLFRQPPRFNGAWTLVHDVDGDPWPGDIPAPIDAGAFVAQTWARAAIKDGKAAPVLPGFG